MMLTIRERTEQEEYQRLSPYAAYAADTKGRERAEHQCPMRTDFARDRDRIIHCSAFRRLKHKTQVFFAPVGDHYRTRLTHTLEVSQIARTICRALRLNEDLVEAIAMGHDLGHTPFGHSGERALDEIAPFPFRHNAHSVRVVEKLERNGAGLNLTFEVRDGIATHSSGKPDSATLEGKVLEYADKIAYINHDIDDAIRAGILLPSELPYDCLYVLGRKKSERITTMIQSIVQHSMDKDAITLSPEVWKAHQNLRQFMFENIYNHPAANGEEEKANTMLKSLYLYFKEHPEKLPDDYLMVVKEEGEDRAVCDYIAGMTDSYAVNLYQSIFIPKNFFSV